MPRVLRRAASESSLNQGFGYDANGNRTGATTRAYTTAATSNRLTNLSNPANAFTHDAAGNTLTGPSAGNTYTAAYNLEGRLATMTVGATTSSYAYDAMGQRTRKYASNAASTTVIFVYDQQGHLLGEYSNTGAALREYVWLGNEPIAVFTPNGTNPPSVFYIHNDHLGKPRVILNTANALRWRWLAEHFGTTAPETNPASLGAFTFNLRMPGQYADSETGLFYNYFRDYDAGTGRYVQSDPIGLAGGINTYSYVGGNPISMIDPNGLRGGDRPSEAMCLYMGHNPLVCQQVPRVVEPPNSYREEQRRCVENYVREHYPPWVADSIPSFSAYSYVPGSPNFASAAQSTAISLTVKGVAVPTLIQGGRAMQTVGGAVAPWVAGAGAIEATGTAFVATGTAAAWGAAIVGAFGLPFATTAETLAVYECGCRRP